MPVYGFYCKECKKEIDVWKNHIIRDDEEEIPCECGGILKKDFGNFSMFQRTNPELLKPGFYDKKYVGSSKVFRG